MKLHLKTVLFTGIIIAVTLVIIFPFHKWARQHVNYKTGVEDHPLLCTSCHLYITKNKLIYSLVNAHYYSPINVAASKDGSKLYIVAQDGNALLIADQNKGKIISRITVGKHPHSVIISNDGKSAWVSNQWSDNVSVIDLENQNVTSTLSTAGGPAGLSLSHDGKYLYVANSYTSDLSVIDLSTGIEIQRLSTGNNPAGTGLSPDGKTLFVTSRRALFAPYGDTLNTEITLVNDSTHRIESRLNIESAYMMENIDFTPSGDMSIFTMIRPKNLVPSIQVEQGFMMTHGIGIIEAGNKNRIIQLLLDEPNAYYSDPFDIVVSKDGKKAFVSNSAVDYVTVIDLDSVRSLIRRSDSEMLKEYSNNLGISSRYVIKRIKTGANPKGLALSPDGRVLFVAEMLQDRISEINTENLEVSGAIDLGGTHRITVARRGRRLLNNAGHTFQNQYSCYTCHPDTHEDGLVYNMASKDMGRNVTNTQSLRDIAETAPFKWNGKNQTVYKQDGIRFSTVLTRTEQFSYRDLDAISSYIMTGISYPPNLQYNPHGILTDAQLRGKAIYEREKDKFGRPIPPNNRCVTCHPAPYYTNRQPADVNTLAASDDSMLFDTPHLTNIYASPPYLHDGRAATLEEIWTIYGTTDKHGMVGDLTKIELNELIEYLKSFRSPEYNTETSDKQAASFSPR
jgi:YVTN family beta-propeller protein